MRTKSGPVPSDSEIRAIEDQVQKLLARIEPWARLMSAEERKRSLRFRPGGAKIVQLVGDLATSQGLSLPGISVQEMRDHLALDRRLANLEAKLSRLHATIVDTRRLARHQCWGSVTALYSALRRLSSQHSKIQDEIKEAKAFFAHGPRKNSKRRRGKKATPKTDE